MTRRVALVALALVLAACGGTLPTGADLCNPACSVHVHPRQVGTWTGRTTFSRDYVRLYVYEHWAPVHHEYTSAVEPGTARCEP